MKKKVKTKNPNNRARLFVVIAIAIVALGAGGYFVGTTIYGMVNTPSGNFDAIVDITSPTVTATLGAIHTEDGYPVNYVINDNEGGSGLLGLCISEYDNLDTAIEADPECFDFVYLESQVNYNFTLELPNNEDNSATTYYAWAKDNFGNISERSSITIPEIK